MFLDDLAGLDILKHKSFENMVIKARYDELVANTSPESVNKRDTQNDEITSELGSRRGFGGAEEARTPDPLLAKQVLSQLSYSPIWSDPYPNYPMSQGKAL